MLSRRRWVHRSPGAIRSSLAWTVQLAEGIEFNTTCKRVAKELKLPLKLVKQLKLSGVSKC